MTRRPEATMDANFMTGGAALAEAKSAAHGPWRNARNAPGGTQSLRRATLILRFLSSCGPRGAVLKEIAFESGLHKATAHRMLAALLDEQLVERDPRNHRYRLGSDIFALAAAMGAQFDIKTMVRPSLERLAQVTRDTAYLGIRCRNDAMCIDMCEGSYPEKIISLRSYDRWPLGVGAFGLALLAYMPDDEIDAIIAKNSPRVAGEPCYTPDKLREAVEETRRRDFAVAYNTLFLGMCGVAVPIFDQQRRPIASLCVAAILSRMDDAHQAEVAGLMWEESRKISGLWCDTRPRGGYDTWKDVKPQ
jgi:DNA-binding IclR family transcriptional regulator